MTQPHASAEQDLCQCLSKRHNGTGHCSHGIGDRRQKAGAGIRSQSSPLKSRIRRQRAWNGTSLVELRTEHESRDATNNVSARCGSEDSDKSCSIYENCATGFLRVSGAVGHASSDKSVTVMSIEMRGGIQSFDDHPRVRLGPATIEDALSGRETRHGPSTGRTSAATRPEQPGIQGIRCSLRAGRGFGSLGESPTGCPPGLPPRLLTELPQTFAITADTAPDPRSTDIVLSEIRATDRGDVQHVSGPRPYGRVWVAGRLGSRRARRDRRLL